MEGSCLRHSHRDAASCPLLFHGRSAGFFIAIPFIFCFSLFGIFNLVGGTVLTIMACKPKFPPKTVAFIQKMIQSSNVKFESQLDPMQVVGIILLLTGSLLVLVGIALGFVACRSVNEQQRRRTGNSFSGIPMSSMAERSSRRTSSFGLGSFASIRYSKGDRKKSLHTENIVSPILEVNSEEEASGNEETRTAIEDIFVHLSTLNDKKSPEKKKDDHHKVMWAAQMSDSGSVSDEIAAGASSDSDAVHTEDLHL
ncbi:uncharacterized protein LOC118196210 [Stegodyphus dumicola]|uniref:uncharacterized protein LOC118196210 n=1 Tax=Stegodyphus dumicola TaxID=202533 RepID=UPI0015B30689|nr:uncharacterized protein LOC118196210 [Stegodyphus dumicola]XP_035223520.1 uncharacterized protein LOC118196210 [Stegodyphus dumicola]XP_035223521.1 uncharacterized protein LOC118196210 [Stegodyphus dumicola]XP_035223522.1 uncharacterized protein LOC118196210 [Stegodyphus dumicola]